MWWGIEGRGGEGEESESHGEEEKSRVRKRCGGEREPRVGWDER